MLKITNTTVERDEEEGMTYTSYDVEGFATLDGTSIWDYDYAKEGTQVKVTHIGVTEYDDEDYGKSIYVTHDKGWEIYTDRGFEQSISSVLGFDVTFTEQGMQDDELASME
jgi:hypothetical protein